MRLQDNNPLITKKFLLDYSTWRCGGNEGENVLGQGGTLLLNDEGYMCCLGQCALQLKVPTGQLLGNSEPADIKVSIPILTYTNQTDGIVDYDEENQEKVLVDIEVFEDNTALSQEAMLINDNPVTTPEEKIERLRKLFAEEGYEIEVINKPE